MTPVEDARKRPTTGEVSRSRPWWRAAIGPVAVLVVLAVLPYVPVPVPVPGQGGAIALRVTGIAFAMVTPAFAQAGSILVLRNPAGSPAVRRVSR